ncbi:MAG: beta-N-acetylhexosaminidase [Candidatus Promineifilaceae bacterium]
MSHSLALLPQPNTVAISAETPFTLNAQTTITCQPASQAEANYLADMLTAITGLTLPVSHDATPTNSIQLQGGTNAERDESYTLNVTDAQVVLAADHAAGLFYAVQTLGQLLSANGGAWEFPAVQIEDAPRFGWRGLHLDVGRHMFPVSFIKKFIDLMALHKFNIFHWHLTEDQGWRLEIKQYPKLAEVSAWRDATPLPATPQILDGKRYGGVYTQDEVREVVAYAQAQHITVVPEIEMPGHTIAVLSAYPDLGCVGEGYKVRQLWGIEDDVFCAGTEAVYTFLENVLTEVFELFPSEFIHIGGDECPKVRWENCEKCQAKIAAEGLKNTHELQSYFIQRIEKFINANGRRLIGWDEILEGGLAPNATVMSWRGSQGGIDAATAGHDVVMSPTTYVYLDYAQSNDTENEPPAATYASPLLLEKTFLFNPTEGVPDDKHHHILGGQANVWTEYIPTPEQAEYMTYPRACAVAESVWSAESGQDFDAFKARLATHLKRLDRFNVNYRPLD